MEGLQKVIRNFSKDSNLGSSSSSFETPRLSEGLSAALSSSDESRVLVARSSRRVVSLWTCSKLCAICFAIGVVVGYTLKRRVRRWASGLLKRLKDD
ncbi:Transmembrane protein [Trema orientale]|uniref:Transmembrane protein n=1 Tax=Trema orientale TaxID=63057 RepID=A0A2P5AQ00_TREOI|nr:Transmembrane protein [Trema orientale]